MKNKFEFNNQSEKRSVEKICEKCGKSFTITTINPKDDIKNRPDICLACNTPGFKENIKKYAKNLKNREIE